jgi:hypothetical protein
VFLSVRQIVVIGVLLLFGGVGISVALWSQQRVIDAAFWFEPLQLESLLDPPLTSEEIATLESASWNEITRAFTGLRITFSDRRDATYRVRVVQKLRDLRFRRTVEVAGESRAIAGFGGQGAVSFEFLAASAIAYAPPEAARHDVIAAIGVGIGRAAVHELAHQLLPKSSIHSDDVQSYEYYSAHRHEQFFGDMHWDRAWPLLEKRLGTEGFGGPRGDSRASRCPATLDA